MKKKERTLDWYLKDLRRFFQPFRLTDDILHKKYDLWKEERVVALPGDFIWSVFKEILLSGAKHAKTEKNLYEFNKEVYFEMYYFLVREKRDGKHIKLLWMENDFKFQYLNSDLEMDVVISSGHCCSHCDSLNGKLFPLKEAINNPDILGLDKCKPTTRKNCNCGWVYKLRRDSNDRLIRKGI